jgi:hypothetical protein
MDIELEESDLDGFNGQAKSKLKEAATSFVSDLIEESNRLESKNNSSGGEPEVTSSNVADADILVRKGLSQNKKGYGTKAIRIIAALLPLVVGAMYDSTKLQDSAYMLIFVIVVTAAIIMVTISTIME